MVTVCVKKSLLRDVKNCLPRREKTPYHEVAKSSYRAHLTNLEELYFGYNKIKDISPLQDMKKLYYLSMGYNNVEDLSVLNALPALSKLSICNNPIKTQSVVMGLNGLSHLRISRDQFTSDEIEMLEDSIYDFVIE